MSTEEKYQNDFKVYEDTLAAVGVNINNCNDFETDEHPMHPRMFYNLSHVTGFNSLNGNTYCDYIKKYKLRHGHS